MKYPPATPTHMCAPPEFRRVPNITGSFEMDRAIWANPNHDMSSRLKFYCGDSREFSVAYGPRNSYNGYDGLSGDE